MNLLRYKENIHILFEMSKRKRSIPVRSDNGRFPRICACINHDTWSFDEIYTVELSTSTKRFGQRVVQSMRENHFLPTRSNSLCTACYKEYKRR